MRTLYYYCTCIPTLLCVYVYEKIALNSRSVQLSNNGGTERVCSRWRQTVTGLLHHRCWLRRLVTPLSTSGYRRLDLPMVPRRTFKYLILPMLHRPTYLFYRLLLFPSLTQHTHTHARGICKDNAGRGWSGSMSTF